MTKPAHIETEADWEWYKRNMLIRYLSERRAHIYADPDGERGKKLREQYAAEINCVRDEAGE